MRMCYVLALVLFMLGGCTCGQQTATTLAIAAGVPLEKRQALAAATYAICAYKRDRAVEWSSGYTPEEE